MKIAEAVTSLVKIFSPTKQKTSEVTVKSGFLHLLKKGSLLGLTLFGIVMAVYVAGDSVMQLALTGEYAGVLSDIKELEDGELIKSYIKTKVKELMVLLGGFVVMGIQITMFYHRILGK